MGRVHKEFPGVIDNVLFLDVGVGYNVCDPLYET